MSETKTKTEIQATAITIKDDIVSIKSGDNELKLPITIAESIIGSDITNTKELDRIFNPTTLEWLLKHTNKNEKLLQERKKRQINVDAKFKEVREAGIDTEKGKKLIAEGLNEYKEVKDQEVNNHIEKQHKKNRGVVDVDPQLEPEFKQHGMQGVCAASNRRQVVKLLNSRFLNLDETFKQKYETNEAFRQEIGDIEAYRNNYINEIFPLKANKHIQNESLDSLPKLLEDSSQYEGIIKEDGITKAIILKNGNLHTILRAGADGKLESVELETNLTAIIDLEDADTPTKENTTKAYKNIRDMMSGEISADGTGNKKGVKLNQDIEYEDKYGNPKKLRATAVPTVRVLGSHVKSGFIQLNDQPIARKVLDKMAVAAFSASNINSVTATRHIVEPKMQGPEEVFASTQMNKELENIFPSSRPMSMGIMNEEGRLNATLKDSLLAGRDVFFVNSGFLDYTASMIDLCRELGVVLPVDQLSKAPFKTEYEANTVEIGKRTKVPQVGAGMYVYLEKCLGAIDSKKDQFEKGNNAAWAPHPVSMLTSIIAVNMVLKAGKIPDVYKARFKKMFQFPVVDKNSVNVSKEEYKNNTNFLTHGTTSYASPWVRKDTGCAAVANLNGELVMEDAATARIKVAILCNWLQHGIITKQDIDDSIRRMAIKINQQYQKAFDDGKITTVKKIDLDADIDSKEADSVTLAVRNAILNTKELSDSNIVEYFLEAREIEIERTKSLSENKDSPPLQHPQPNSILSGQLIAKLELQL